MDEDFLSLDELGENLDFAPDDYGGFLPEEKMPANVEDLDESKIDHLLEAVKNQYTMLEQEKSRLVLLKSLLTDKINLIVHKEFAANLKTEPRSCPLNLDVTAYGEEEDEEDEEAEE